MIYTLKEFTKLCVDNAMIGKNALFLGSTEKKYKARYKLVKSKEVVKSIKEIILDERDIPFLKTTKGTSKQVVNTNAVLNLIIDYIRFFYPKSSTFRRISSEGKYRVGVGYIPSSNKGMSDAEGMVNGKFLSLELKIGKDRQQESQKERQIEVESDGGIYYLCKWVDFEQFQREIQQLIPIQ